MTFHLLKRRHAVKKSRFTEKQIAFALKHAETGTRIDEICRKLGISDATFYNRRKSMAAWGLQTSF
jgi:putative transposase